MGTSRSAASAAGAPLSDAGVSARATVEPAALLSNASRPRPRLFLLFTELARQSGKCAEL
jgi:hypothetical protein